MYENWAPICGGGASDVSGEVVLYHTCTWIYGGWFTKICAFFRVQVNCGTEERERDNFSFRKVRKLMRIMQSRGFRSCRCDHLWNGAFIKIKEAQLCPVVKFLFVFTQQKFYTSKLVTVCWESYTLNRSNGFLRPYTYYCTYILHLGIARICVFKAYNLKLERWLHTGKAIFLGYVLFLFVFHTLIWKGPYNSRTWWIYSFHETNLEFSWKALCPVCQRLDLR